jgi:selenocysteine lyase/cysteine desulfurase
MGIRLADDSRIPGVMKSLSEREVRVSQRGRSIRVSPNVYNTPEDIDALLAGFVAGVQ